MDSNESMLEELLAMGFPEALSRLAVTNSGGSNLEELINWILVASNQEEGVLSERMKMVLVVRMDLNMSPGKVASQCVHAALGTVRSVESTAPHVISSWRSEGEPVICLRCTSLDELQHIQIQCQEIKKSILFKQHFCL